jgi:hypothetical protein
MTETEAAVVRAYLCDGLSHREIERQIMGIDAAERGGGFEAMTILHKFGIKKPHKWGLRGRRFDSRQFEYAGSIDTYLREAP